MNILSLFDGMACGLLAAKRAGIPITNYYSSEIDKHAITVAAINNPELQPMGDVENWRNWHIDWSSIDLLIAGSPCQGFSLMGNQLAFDDPRSRLFFVFVDILNHIRALNPDVKFLLENVKMKPAFLQVIDGHLGVESIVINSNKLSAHHRTRYYWANWGIRQPEQKLIDPCSILEPSEKQYYPATARKGDPRPVVFTGWHFLCMPASYYKGIRSDGRPAAATKEGVFDELRKTNDVRILTPLECERLQTVPDNYTAHVSNTQRYKMLGNGWTVDVIAHIFEELKRQEPCTQ